MKKLIDEILLRDEIHLKAYFKLKDASVIGVAFNTNKAVTCAVVFKIGSLHSPYEIVPILSVKCINFEIFYKLIKKGYWIRKY